MDHNNNTAPTHHHHHPVAGRHHRNNTTRTAAAAALTAAQQQQQQQQVVAVTQAVVAAAQDAAVQDQLDQYDDLLQYGDQDALAKFRLKRLQELQLAARQEQRWRATAGHGSYEELVGASTAAQGDTRDAAKAFFDATKASERLVVHFYRPTTACCNVFHQHLRILAAQHWETRFIKINVQDCDDTRQQQQQKGASFLVQRLGIVVMPTLVLIHKRKVVHQIIGFDELGATTDFSTAALARLLQHYNVLFAKDRSGGDNDSDDDGDDDYYECGHTSNNSNNNDSNGWKGVNAIRINRESRYNSSRGRRRRGEDEEEEDF